MDGSSRIRLCREKLGASESWSRAPAELFEQYLRERNIVDPRLLALFGELLEEVQ